MKRSPTRGLPPRSARNLPLGLLTLLAACTQPRESGALDTSDLHRFVAAYAAASPSDSTCTWLNPYLREGTPGLRAYTRKHEVSRADLCQAIRRQPTRYASLVGKVTVLDGLSDSLAPLYTRFDSLFPGRPRPAIYVLVGSGISLGSIIRTTPPKVLLGAELIGHTAGLTHMIAHELFHTLQDYPMIGSLNGGPAFLGPLRGTVLRHSIAEGSADLFADLIAGAPSDDGRRRYGDTHEAEIWVDFQHDMDSKIYRNWLFNGWRRDSLGGRPPDLGYYVGYRIAKSYYDHAADKAKAVRDMANIRDFPAFLRASGYQGGHD